MSWNHYPYQYQYQDTKPLPTKDNMHILTSNNPESFESIENLTKTLNLFEKVVAKDTGYDVIAHLPGALRGDAAHNQSQHQLLQRLQQKPQKGIQGKQPKHHSLPSSYLSQIITDHQITEERGQAKNEPDHFKSFEATQQRSYLVSEVRKTAESPKQQCKCLQFLFLEMPWQAYPKGTSKEKEKLDYGNRKAHFFESNSKYLSFKPQSNVDQSKWIKSLTYVEPGSADKIIQKWFRNLTVDDKAIALTIVDKELINLFKAMYRIDGGSGYSGGKFTAHSEDFGKFANYNSSSDCQSVPGYKILYIKPRNTSLYQSSNLREKEQAVSELIEHVRIITVNSPNDALTIDVDFITNMDYFMKIMKLIDEEFLIREQKVNKETQIEGSLLLPIIDSKRPYFHIQDYQKQVFYSMQGSSSMQISSESDLRNPNTQITLAKCLLLSFEKALNIHFLDQSKRLTPPMQQQFILKDFTCNPFERDLKLASWWLTVQAAQKQTYLDQVKEMEKKIIQVYNSIKSKFEDIKEQEEAEENNDDLNEVIRGMQQLQCEESYASKRRRGRKDRQRDGHSSSSNSGMFQAYGDYNQKQLIIQYGDRSDSDEPDLESQRFKPQVHVNRNDLFGADKTDNTIFKCRQTLVGKGMAADDLGKCLVFIKSLSMCKSFEVLIHENKDGTPYLKKVGDLVASLLSQFYVYLDEMFQKSIVDDLLEISQDKKKKKKLSKNMKKKQKEEVKEEVLTQVLPEIKIDLAKKELDLTPSKLKDVELSSDQSIDYQMQTLMVLQNYENLKKQQDKELFDMQMRLEFLDQRQSDGSDSDFLEKQLTSQSTLCNDQLIMTSEFHRAMAGPMRYKEERTGLLSNQVHMDKYTNETEFLNETQRQKQAELMQYLIGDDKRVSLNDSQQSNDENDSDHEGIQMIRRYCEELPKEETKEEAGTQKIDLVKKKKTNKKNRRKKKIQGAEVEVIEQKQAQVYDTQLDEIVCGPEPLQQKKPKLKVRKNNFFSDDNSSVSSNCPSQVIYIQQDNKPDATEREQLVQKITTIALNNAVSATQIIEDKKNKKKGSKLKKETNEVSNKMCCLTPLILSVSVEPQKLKGRFEADLSDKVKIPSRGKSISSYGKEELQHVQTLQELDSLFPSPNGSSKPPRGNSSDDKKKSNNPFNDVSECDVVSQKNPRTMEEDLTGFERRKNHDDVADVLQKSKSTKKNKNKSKRAKQEEMTLTQAISTVVIQPKIEQKPAPIKIPEAKSEPANQKKWKETKLSPQVTRFQQKKQGTKQLPQKPVTQTVQAKQTVGVSQQTVTIGTTFESYDSMFQTIFGASALSPKPQKIADPPTEPVQPVPEKPAKIAEVTPQTGPTEESEIVAEAGPEQKQKLTKKQQKKQQSVAEFGIMATPDRSFSLASSTVQAQQIQTHNKTITIYKQRQPSEPPYVSSSFQTPDVTHSERGAANIQTTNSLQQNVSINFNFPKEPISFNNQPQLFQQMQYNQQYQMINPMFLHPSYPPPNQMQYFHQYHPQFQFQPYMHKQPFFEIVSLSDALNLDKRAAYWQQHEDQFHLNLGQQLLAVQTKIDSWLLESEQHRLMSYELVCRVIRDTYPELSLNFDVYGSMATKLAIDTSDMDIAIYGISSESRPAAMTLVHQRLAKCESIVSNQLIATASVPVIKLEISFEKLATDLKIEPRLVGKIKSIRVDLIFNEVGNDSIHQTKRTADFLKQKIVENPFLKPLAQVLKKYLQLKNLNSPFQGTISSYGLVLMIITLLQDMQRQIPNLQFTMNTPYQYHQPSFEQYLGRAFSHFFMVYGDQQLFNTQTVMLNSMLEFEEANQQFKNELVLLDPTDQFNNVGKQTYNFANVQEQLSIQLRCLIVRFKEIQEKMLHHDNLVYERDEVQMGIQQQHQIGVRKQPQPKNENIQLVQQITDKINTILFQIQQVSKTTLDRIIMVDCQGDDFLPIFRDEVEEKQKIMHHQIRQISSLLQAQGGLETKQQYGQQKLQNLFFHPMKMGLLPQNYQSVEQTQQIKPNTQKNEDRERNF